jgi:hypothetical protein
MNTSRKVPPYSFTIIILLLTVLSIFAVSLDSLQVTSLAINRNAVFAGTSDGSLAWSADTGKTWTIQAVGLCTANVAGARRIYDIKILRDTIYIATYCGIFRSAIGSVGWKDVSTGLTDLRSITLHLFNGALFAGGNNGVYRFSPVNVGWQKLTVDSVTAPSSGYLPCRAITHTGPTIIAAYNSRVYSTENNGDSWKNISTALVAMPDSIKTRFSTFYDSLRFIDYLGASNSTITAAGFDGSVFVSSDLGASWTLTRAGCPWCDMIMMLGFFSDSVGSFYAGPSNRIDVSHDGGVHWTTASTSAPFFGSAVFVRFGDLMAVGTTQGVFFSGNEFKTVSRSIVPSTAHPFRSHTTYVSQRVVATELFDLQGRRLPSYDASSAKGGHTASGIFITKLRLKTGRCAPPTSSARLKSPLFVCCPNNQKP